MTILASGQIIPLKGSALEEQDSVQQWTKRRIPKQGPRAAAQRQRGLIKAKLPLLKCEAGSLYFDMRWKGKPTQEEKYIFLTSWR